MPLRPAMPVISHTHLSDDQHVHIVPMTWAGKGRPLILAESNFAEGVMPFPVAVAPDIINISSRAPAFGEPGVGLRIRHGAIVGDAVDNISARRADGIAHHGGAGQ